MAVWLVADGAQLKGPWNIPRRQVPRNAFRRCNGLQDKYLRVIDGQLDSDIAKGSVLRVQVGQLRFVLEDSSWQKI